MIESIGRMGSLKDFPRGLAHISAYVTTALGLLLFPHCAVEDGPLGPDTAIESVYPLIGEECPPRFRGHRCLSIDAPIENGSHEIGWGCHNNYDGTPPVWERIWWSPTHDQDPSLDPPPPDCPEYWPAPDGTNYTNAPTPAMCKEQPWRHLCPCDIAVTSCAVDEPGDGENILMWWCREHAAFAGLGFWRYVYWTPERCGGEAPGYCDSFPRCDEDAPWIPYPQ